MTEQRPVRVYASNGSTRPSQLVKRSLSDPNVYGAALLQGTTCMTSESSPLKALLKKALRRRVTEQADAADVVHVQYCELLRIR